MKSVSGVLPPQLVLASASPRRRELLAQIGIDFKVQAADIDERVGPQEPAEAYVTRMAAEKGAVVAATLPSNTPVLSADTIVVVGQQILGKPRDYDHALDMLTQLSGTNHAVVTAVNLRTGGAEAHCLVTTRVRFCELTSAMLEAYLDTDEPWDKAGGYGIQGIAGAFVVSLEGSYSNVVGLPLAETWQMLARVGIRGVLSGQ